METKQLYFNPENATESEALSFLSKVPRKQSFFVATALKEFIEKYGLSEKSEKELKNFAVYYPFLASLNKANTSMPVLTDSPVEIVKDNKAVKKETAPIKEKSAETIPLKENELQNILSQNDLSTMKNALAAFNMG